MYFCLVMAKFQHLFIYWILTIWQAQNKSRTTLNSNMPLLFFQGTSRIYLIIYQVLGNSLHCQETDDLHNFQFHRLEFLHIHCHCHNRLGLFHIYALLCSNSKNSDILKLIIVTCNRGHTILCTWWAPANKRKLILSTSRKFSMSCQVS